MAVELSTSKPGTAKLLQGKKKLCDYLLASYCVPQLLGEHAIQKDSDTGPAEFEKRMQLRRATDDGQQWKRI